jgi:hypothetical protein
METIHQNKVSPNMVYGGQVFDQLLIYRTDIKSKKKLKVLQPILDQHPLILHWTLDREDADNVLRMEVREGIRSDEIKRLIKARGFNCEEL